MSRSKYPTVAQLCNVRNLPDDTIIYLTGMRLLRTGDTYSLYDGDTYLPVSNLPQEWKDKLDASQGSGLIGVNMHIRVYYVSDYDYYHSWRSKVEYQYYSPKPSKCTCGAEHTFMYNYHSHWCDANTLE